MLSEGDKEGMIFKGISEGFKDVDVKQGIVCGYFSHFGTKDSDGDIILPGAYSKTISENGPKSSNPRIKHLLDHDKRKAVATLTELKEDEIGLYYESKAGRHTTGRDFLLMVEDGIITEHSVGFETIKENTKDGNNYMTELKLWEGSSLQCWGSNMNTPITGVKEFELETLLSSFNNLSKAIRNGKYTDETFQELNIRLIGIEQAIKDLNAPIKDTEPITITQDVPNPDLQAIEIINEFTRNFKL